jgi:hypothetical protein
MNTLKTIIAMTIGGIALIIQGCGMGDPEGETSHNPDVTSSPFLEINLASGAIKPLSSDPGTGSADTLSLKNHNRVLIGVTEITRGQWQTVMGTTPWQNLTAELAINANSSDANLPAVNISRQAAQEFTAELSRRFGLPVSFPTKAEIDSIQATSATGEQAVFDGGTSTAWSFKRVAEQSNHNGWYGIEGNAAEYIEDQSASYGKSIASLKNEPNPSTSPVCLSGLRIVIR